MEPELPPGDPRLYAQWRAEIDAVLQRNDEALRRALAGNLEFLTWLGMVYNTYWARLAAVMDQKMVQGDLASALKEAADEVERILDRQGRPSQPGPGA
jgi:hypothetical protein